MHFLGMKIIGKKYTMLAKGNENEGICAGNGAMNEHRIEFIFENGICPAKIIGAHFNIFFCVFFYQNDISM